MVEFKDRVYPCLRRLSGGYGKYLAFPYRMATYGGSFLLVYLIFDVLLGFSGVVGEMSFGRAVRSGPVEAFGTACASRGESKRNI